MKVVVIFFLLVLLPSNFLETNIKIDALILPTSSLDSLKGYVYNVGLSFRPGNSEDFIVNLLTSILGSEKAAKKAFLWSYDDTSFAAYLTREQAKHLGELRGVASVKEDVGFPVDKLPTNLIHQGSES